MRTPWLLLAPALLSLGFTRAEYDERVGEVKARLAAKGKASEFHVLVEEPFVVVGDGSERALRRHCRGTIRWAVDRLENDFSLRRPAEILEVWLFRDEESYFDNVHALFGETPRTPYGYYAERHRALIMNVGTGGGTLVHEIVHPFLDASFPGRPAWLSEGLGSLFEQSGERDGRIVGRTNWRLGGLQKAIRAGRLPPFARLLAAGEREFYTEDLGTNYAQARYLLYYLQENGKLLRFYTRFLAARDSDPTGARTLLETLGTSSLEELQKEWEGYVLKLRFPEAGGETPARAPFGRGARQRWGATPGGR